MKMNVKIILFLPIILQVVAEDCSMEGAIRLDGGAATSNGRVEVCHAGQWGTVCDEQWGASDARVVCRQLGENYAYAEAMYQQEGGGSLPMLFSGFYCTGNETQLTDCPVEHTGNSTDCAYYRTAGVRCPSVPCKEDSVRLNGGNVVEVCYGGRWGLVCAHFKSWDEGGVKVVCSEVGLDSKSPQHFYIGREHYEAPVVINDVSCSGTEDSLTACDSLEKSEDFPHCDYIAAALCEVEEPCSTQNSIRLTPARGGGQTEGRLEVCSGGSWGSICGKEATSAIATVACRELHHAANGTIFAGGEFTILSFLVPTTRTNMMCSGNETVVAECMFDGVDGDPDCNHESDLFISCQPRECQETDIRLYGYADETPNYGGVEICLHGVWGGVCDDQWDDREAKVVCQQLGYDGPSYSLLNYYSPEEILHHLDDVNCYGNESLLSECIHPGIGNENCARGIEYAGVICTDSTCIDGAVHLVGGAHISRGRVEYCHNGSWYSVCASDWDITGEEARAICQSIDYYIPPWMAVVMNFGRGSNPILPLKVKCTIDDEKFSDCTKTPFDASSCPEVAGVNCIAPCLTEGLTDCTVCGNRLGCNIHPYCNCHSRCLEYGDCCSDVSLVENCVVKECDTGEIRLVGGVTNSTGRLELCVNGIWGRVCNRFDYWGPDNAKVVCRQLGFSEIGAYVVDNASVFGVSERNPVVGEVHCLGTEPELLECSHGTLGQHFCGLHLNYIPDIAISCYDEAISCKDGSLRLQGGVDNSSGIVEYCKYRTWGTLCNDGWDNIDASVACRQLGFNPANALAQSGFKSGEGKPVFLTDLSCDGSEMELSECTANVATSECKSAGITCQKSSNTDHCTGKETKIAVNDIYSFGDCEPYMASAGICENVRNIGTDFVYISHKLAGNQSSTVTVLNEKLEKAKLAFSSQEKSCIDLVLKIACHYYLPSCGTLTDYHPPNSVCEEECEYVKSECSQIWYTALLAFEIPLSFISCDDTSKLLYPLPNCCTGAGIELPKEKSSSAVTPLHSPVPQLPDNSFDTTDTSTTHSSSRSSTGQIVGAVFGVLLVIVVIAVTAVAFGFLYMRYLKLRQKKQFQRLQRDIFAMSEPNEVTSTTPESHPEQEGGGDAQPEKSFVEPDHATADNVINPYESAIPGSSKGSFSVSGESRTRVQSYYMRELTRGRFIVKYSDITLLDTIGEGEFGIVYKGKLGHAGRREVAVKTLKGHFDQVDVDRFVEESLKMSRFKHSHVMGLIGVCLDAGSAPFIIMPYMANGSLLKYLKKERETIVLSEDNTDLEEIQDVCKRLLVMCSQIASGMEYLAAGKYLHRDLAARNCMIDTHFLIKITDFGLSEDVFLKNYFRQGSSEETVKLPVKWMAPESLTDGHFSEKSDVWSYGVTMWEIFSGGKVPYPGTDPVTLIQHLDEGHRMSKPYNAACNDEIYSVMKKCWEASPKDRPSFTEIYEELSHFIERVAGYLDIKFNPFLADERGKDTTGKDIETQ